MRYDPEIHNRHSIRLRGYDYAGDGLYFITICAHREFVRFAKGNPFGAVGATRMSPCRTRMSPSSRTSKLSMRAFVAKVVALDVYVLVSFCSCIAEKRRF